MPDLKFPAKSALKRCSIRKIIMGLGAALQVLNLTAYISIPAHAQRAAAAVPAKEKYAAPAANQTTMHSTSNQSTSKSNPKLNLVAVRVIVLAPAAPALSTPQTQQGIERTVEKIMTDHRQARRKRRRLFALPGAAPGKGESGTAANTKDTPKPLLKPSAPRVKSSAGKPGDVVPPEQRLALAQTLLTDIVAERLQERLGVLVVPEEEVKTALARLHLTSAEITATKLETKTEAKVMGLQTEAENRRRLCAALHCQALIIPRLMQCEVRDGLTRNVSLFVHVQTETMLDTPPGPSRVQGFSASTPKRQMGAEALKMWTAQLSIAGVSSSERVLFHSQYKKKQQDCIRDAAQQAANLLAHTLRTGEFIPFMQFGDRLAIAPILAPAQADKLLFTPTGRRVAPVAVHDLTEDVSALFTPDLLPLTSTHIVDADEVKEAFAKSRQPKTEGKTNTATTSEESLRKCNAALWTADHRPDIPHVQALARQLRVDYILLTRIADIELSDGVPGPAQLAASGPAAETLERSASVEAVAILVRVADGRLLWEDRGSATMQAVSSRPQTYPILIRDATRFALIELQRRLRQYRTKFED